MAGGHLKYRHLNRSSSHRQALLRNLVTSLITHESIRTTWPKAKEAQRLAEKLITLGKKNTNASRRKAQSIFYEPLKHLPTLFTTLRERYLNRPGGYTRVLRIEPINRNNDQAPSAILELVDGPRDMRFAMTAKTLVRERSSDEGIREITARNVAKVTRFRENGEAELEKTVRRLETMKGLGGEEMVEEGHDEREPWEPFSRMKQRRRDMEDETRPSKTRRIKRNPDTGRRAYT
ncbi:50S ribosomal protein L17 [Usnea florida]